MSFLDEEVSHERKNMLILSIENLLLVVLLRILTAFCQKHKFDMIFYTLALRCFFISSDWNKFNVPSF